MKDYYFLAIVLAINCLMFWLILRKLSLMIEKFKEYEFLNIQREDVKFKKNQESLERLKQLFDRNKENEANESKGVSTNKWDSVRRTFAPMAKRVENE